MLVLVCQGLILGALGVLLGLWARSWPNPSPAIRPLLPPRQRWPEAQIRDMLARERFHPGYLSFFDRDPIRSPGPGNGLLAPADGVLLSADVREGWRYIVIALSFWDVHVQRSPLAGRLVSVEASGTAYRDGEGRDFAFLADKYRPVQKRLVIAGDQGEIALRLITSVAARRIEVWPARDEVIARGQRIGRIRLGSTVVLEVPADRVCQAAVGSRVRAGETVLVAEEAVPA